MTLLSVFLYLGDVEEQGDTLCHLQHSLVAYTCISEHTFDFDQVAFFWFVIAVTEVQFPCIRSIVIKSTKLKVGTLFIITYTGGTIGR